MPRHVHLVGSVPLSSAEAVFRTTSSLLGPRLLRIPDGEIGERRVWIQFQVQRLSLSPQLHFDGPTPDFQRLVDPTYDPSDSYTLPRLTLRPGVDPASITFPPLGYADAAIASYATFTRLKAEGVIGSDVRMQVSLPTPFACIAFYIVPKDMFAVFPAYQRALLHELALICAAIPAHQLAVQFDVAAEFCLYEGVFPPPPGDWRAFLEAQYAGLGAAVPDGVELGFHLCYGDLVHRHFVEPKDTAVLVDVANTLSRVVTRPIHWLHMPVPRSRDDVGFYEPLKGLEMREETELFLGLLHLTDGEEGSRRRLAVAEKVVGRPFGLGTECGLGRRNDDTIPRVLDLYDVMSR